MDNDYEYFDLDTDLCRIAKGDLVGDRLLGGKWIKGGAKRSALESYGMPVSSEDAAERINA